MKMIPATPHGTHSKAEKRVFDRLYAAFVNEWNDSLVAYHSLGFGSLLTGTEKSLNLLKDRSNRLNPLCSA